jgi:TetR/AcrR family transcriptional repressor of nem operon
MDQKTNRQETSDQILDIAQGLIQTRGYNAFSYADISAALGITKASLHYHFRTKCDLGLALVERYHRALQAKLDAIDRAFDTAPDQLRAYVAIYADVLTDNRMCLCGMLAAEFETLAKPVQDALDRYFETNERWLAGTLARGRAAGTLDFPGEARDVAQFLVDALEGAMLMARSHGTSARFDAAASRLLAGIGA